MFKEEKERRTELRILAKKLTKRHRISSPTPRQRGEGRGEIFYLLDHKEGKATSVFGAPWSCREEKERKETTFTPLPQKREGQDGLHSACPQSWEGKGERILTFLYVAKKRRREVTRGLLDDLRRKIEERRRKLVFLLLDSGREERIISSLSAGKKDQLCLRGGKEKARLFA